jgi:hypothetical protein
MVGLSTDQFLLFVITPAAVAVAALLQWLDRWLPNHSTVDVKSAGEFQWISGADVRKIHLLEIGVLGTFGLIVAGVGAVIVANWP